MRNVKAGGSYCARALLAALMIGLACTVASADVSLLGVQYQEDNPYTEYLCFWHDRNYPTSCSIDLPGANLHVYLKNDGASAVTLDDVDLEGYSLATVIKQKWLGDHDAYSIWFYWDNPPDAILNAGEPAWFRMTPDAIPAGEVGEVIVRCRRVPTTSVLDVDVDTSANVIYADVTVDDEAPILANISFSPDLKTVYMYWRRPDGTGPTTIKMDGTDITSDCETVSDANLNMACTVYTRSTALSEMDYHVFQGIYSDSAEALGGIRVWKNPFIYGSWAAFDIADNDYTTAAAWIDTCYDRGLNTYEMNSSSGLNDYLGTSAGRAYATAHNYGFIKDDTSWGTWEDNPRLWFIDDEPDIEENALVANFCGTGYKLPCGSNPAGTMGMHMIAQGESLRNIKDRPTTINLDGTFKPYSWAAYGQLVDVLCVDSYYEKRCMASYYFYTNTQPLYENAKLQYATSLAGSWYAEPGPFRLLSFSCEANPACCDPWPWADPESKRSEIYFALAGGCKGINYWWFKDGNPSDGLGGPNTNLVPSDADLWREIGLLGAEIKLLQPYLVTSHPIDVDVTGSTDVFVKALVHSTDTLILIAINENHYIDEDWHGTDTTNAHIYLTMPDWMTVPVPTAFEVSRRGLENVSTSIDGDEMDLSIGTLSVGRLFVVTNDPDLRMELQDRYDYDVFPGVHDFASSVADSITDAPSIVKHPTTQYVLDGGTATFRVVAAGGSQMSFQWQKNSSDLVNGGDISGATTYKLQVADADTGHEGNYRCKVTNAYGNVTSNTGSLVISTVNFSSHPTTTSVCSGGTASFSVSATGSGTLSYQWQLDESDLSNGGHYSNVTTATMTVSSASSADEGDYRCRVTDSNGPAYSNSAALTLAAGVTFSSHPDGVLIEEGETAVFSVSATGEGTLSYQWQKDGSNMSNGGDVSGVMTATLTIQNVDSGDEADYRCVVTDDCGSSNSNTASLMIDVCGDALVYGDMDGTYSSGVCQGWSSYVIGGLACTFNSGGGNPFPGQRMDSTKLRATRYFGVRQTVDATAGDAFTFGGDVYCYSNSNNAACTIRVDWDGGTSISGASTVVTADQPLRAWTAMGYGSGNATGTSVTIFLDTRGFDDGNVDGDSYYDNIVSYRAHVPVAPTVSTASSTSLDVNVNPGCNTTNSDAQYAITIGGGAYTLGTHWVQTNGTVSGSEAWQTDSSWGTKEVTGLSTGVTYTFKVKARYSSSYTEDTSLSSGASKATESSLSITSHPESEVLCSGQTATFSVTASGGGTLTYQWRKDESDMSNGGDISGVTTSTLTIVNVDSSDEADYECEVSDSGDTVVSDSAELTLADTTITEHPSDQDGLNAGQTATFTVEANYGLGEGLTYQWQKDSSDLSNGGDISGVTTTTLTIEDVAAADEGDYRCVVTGTCDSANSNTASLSLCTPPSSLSNGDFESGFTSGIGDNWTTYIQSGATVTYSEGTSSPPEGSSFQTIEIALPAGDNKHAGVYQVVTGLVNGNTYTISGYYKTDTQWSSDIVSVLVDTNGGTDYSVAEETVATKTGNGTGTDPYSNIWTTFSGEITTTGTSITIFLDVEMDDVASGHTGSFDAIEISGCGAVSAPTISSHPSAQDVCAGATATFSVTASGATSYQWQKSQSDLSNGGDISGATTSTLTIANVESGDAANYRCVVSNAGGSTNSNEAALTLKDATSITDHPDNEELGEGETATFTVAATGEGTVTYQWQVDSSDLSNGGDISGVTTATLTIENVEEADEGNYRCVVTATCGSVNSNTASLTVSECPDPVMENGGFESGFTSGLGDNWTSYVQSGATGSFSEGTSSPPEGSSYQLIEVYLPTGDNKHAGVYQTITGLVNGNTYTISGYYRTDTKWNSDIVSVLVDTNGGTDYSAAEETVASKTGNGTGTDPYSDVFTTFSGDITATGTSITIFLDVEMDDVASGHEGAFDDIQISGCADEDAMACIDLDELEYGDMNGTYTSGVCAGWSSYVVGGLACTFDSGGGNPYPGQRLDSTKVRATRYFGVYQNIEDCNVGDAFTLSGDVYCLSNSNNVGCSIRVDWDGGTSVSGASIEVMADQPSKAWTAMGYGSGNATGSSVTVFLDTRGYTSSNVDGDSYYDNIVAYHAYVPDAPAVSVASSTSLDVDVDPGCNQDNSSAQYAITISGGGYTEGTHWVQSDGSVSTSVAWQTDSSWGTTEVTGLSTSTTYTFKVKARYSSSYTEDTSLGSGTSETPS